MQDCAPPLIAKPFMKLLKKYFRIDTNISRHFPTACVSKSPNLSLWNFCLWGYLKNAVLIGYSGNFAELMVKLLILAEQDIHKVISETFYSVVKHAVYFFQQVRKMVYNALNTHFVSLAIVNRRFDCF